MVHRTDTDGPDEFFPVLVKGIPGNGDREKELYEKLRDAIGAEHPVLEVKDTASKGSYNKETGVISINTAMLPMCQWQGLTPTL